MSKNEKVRINGRPRGRPRLTIDRDAVADAVAELFHEGGYEAVSIVDTAEKLSVSRATLYRTVPTKQDLLGILFERSTREITEQVEAAMRDIDDPADQLREMVRLQSEAAVQMRSYMPVFFGGGDLPHDVVQRWHRWSRQFEKLWVSVVAANMEAGYLEKGDEIITTRLILGMILWVSRWYRPRDKISSAQIADEAIRLLRLGYIPPESGDRKSGAQPRRRRSSNRLVRN
ncbi:TetR/AcrR family transcriptional regulator [Mycobacterium palustre]|uniref:TetR/AcrR family transcriptional regulator n=1 Tax=Mycobacterium palustre TaxID=153971 RepID=UPI0011517ABF|nr:TetR/AcrR family transcriptional regulator [Mycobacterium palustre]MCV7102738.1 TetR/AcrR family transcriptional regulator [Mycobacterium palustre]